MGGIINTLKSDKMNTTAKEQIKTDLGNYVAKVGSMNAASKRLNSVSIGTISNILAGKFDNISDGMLTKIQNQVKNTGWVHNDTTVSKQLDFIYSDIKAYSEVRGIISPTAWGKSHSAKRFIANNTDSFRICCDEFMTKRDFLEQILISIGKTSEGRTISRMLNAIVEHLLKMENPLIIFDEFDKVRDEIMMFFISFYNRTEDKAALIIQGAPYLKERILDGVRKGKKGYAEVYSRLNNNFIELQANKAIELKNIAQLNGVADENEAMRIVNDASGSIRRIKASTRVYLMRKEVA
jgi:hypothetical protein